MIGGVARSVEEGGGRASGLARAVLEKEEEKEGKTGWAGEKEKGRGSGRWGVKEGPAA